MILMILLILFIFHSIKTTGGDHIAVLADINHVELFWKKSDIITNNFYRPISIDSYCCPAGTFSIGSQE